MLLPKRTKYRKVRKGRITGVATRGEYIAFGEYALQAEGHGRISARQIEAARQAMTRYIKRGGKMCDFGYFRIRQLPRSRLM